MKLSALAVKKSPAPSKLCDGNGLWLRTDKAGNRYWLFRYYRNNKNHEMGIGPYPDIQLAEARDLAAEQRKLLRQGIDPILKRKQDQQLNSDQATTFKHCAEAYINTREPEWNNDKHGKQWRSTLETYAYPVIGDIPVSEIDTPALLKILEPIWNTKNETANRVRQRIKTILDWARVKHYRAGDNPAEWEGHLDHLLAKPSKIKTVKHHAAMPWKDIPAFMAELAKRDTTSAKAMIMTIITAKRTNEVIEAVGNEFDLDQLLWTIPANRMKANREHREPLTTRVALLVRRQLKRRIMGNEHIYPGRIKDKSISNIAMLKYLKEDMQQSELTVHGFRSTFRDWVAEATTYPRELAEACLAHTLKDKTEAAYQRGDLLERRRELMQAWEDYLFSESA